VGWGGRKSERKWGDGAPLFYVFVGNTEGMGGGQCC